MISRSISLALLLALPLGFSGCAWMVEGVTARLAQNLSAATLGHDDPQTVRDGAPAFLLLVDGLIEGSPDDTQTLLAGSRLYSAYVGAFVGDPDRAKRLADRAFEYGRRALCEREPSVCAAVDGPFDDFASRLAEVSPRNIDGLYVFSTAWAGWVQVHADDWNAIAQLPKVEAALRRVVEIDDGYDDGNAHLYLGVLNTQLPSGMGGRPELGRQHFERSIALSKGRNLLAKVLFAKQYARLTFDRNLHDRLLREVLESDPRSPGLTLSNVLAQEQASELLEESADYF